jgi:hypothetical protein
VNYDDAADWGGNNGNLTTVGSAGIASTSWYGTYDQGGNVAEWMEGPPGANRIVRGGSWSDSAHALRATTASSKAASTASNAIGFRIARTIPCLDCDDDADGVPDGADCAPLDPTIWARPREIPALLAEGKLPTRLTWGEEGPSVRYDVASGTLSALRADRGTASASCLAAAAAVTTLDDARPNPGTSEGYYYMVRARNSCGAGPYGFSSSGAPETPVAACP